jgi:hypothetical protein
MTLTKPDPVAQGSHAVDGGLYRCELAPEDLDRQDVRTPVGLNGAAVSSHLVVHEDDVGAAHWSILTSG